MDDPRIGRSATASRSARKGVAEVDPRTIAILAQAALAAAIIVVGVMWVLTDGDVRPAVADERLHPRAPRKRRPDNRIGATRALLEAYLAVLRRQHGDAELVKKMPVMIGYAYLPDWTSDAITLDKPIGGWLLRYTGGPSATAVAPTEHSCASTHALGHQARRTRGCSHSYAWQEARES